MDKKISVTDWMTDWLTDICIPRAAFAAENWNYYFGTLFTCSRLLIFMLVTSQQLTEDVIKPRNVSTRRSKMFPFDSVSDRLTS